MGVLEIQAIGEGGGGEGRKLEGEGWDILLLSVSVLRGNIFFLKRKLASVFPWLKFFRGSLCDPLWPSPDSFMWFSAPLWPPSLASPANLTSLQQYQSTLSILPNSFSYSPPLLKLQLSPFPIALTTFSPLFSLMIPKHYVGPSQQVIRPKSSIDPSLPSSLVKMLHFCMTLIVLFDYLLIPVFLVKLWHP